MTFSEKKNYCIDWLKEHRTELLISGITMGTIACFLIGIKNQRDIDILWSALVDNKKDNHGNPVDVTIVENVEYNTLNDELDIANYGLSRAPHDVVRHIRNLPEGCRASAEKIQEAAELGYNLKLNQTIVDAYSTGSNVA